MKIAVMSDIHSNFHAFRRCVDYTLDRGIKNFLFLGDYVSDCAYPQKTMELLYELREKYQCWFIKGNREEYLLNHRNGANDGWKSPSSATGSLLYTYENLTEKDFEFFNGLAIAGHMKIEGYSEFEYCHGSLEASRGNLTFGSASANEALDKIQTGMIVCGHTHQQGIYEHNDKKIVNTGSVGIPWSYNGDAQFAILHSNASEWNIEFVQLDYNKQDTVRELYQSGLNQHANIWIKLVEETLLTGVDNSMDCLIRAMKICHDKEGKADWSTLSEEYWETAAKK